MSTIKIDEKYRVEIDRYNFILIRHYPMTEKSKAHDKVLGYYPSLSHALIGLKREKVARNLNNVTIDGYIDKLRNLENWTGEILNEQKKQKA